MLRLCWEKGTRGRISKETGISESESKEKKAKDEAKLPVKITCKTKKKRSKEGLKNSQTVLVKGGGRIERPALYCEEEKSEFSV